MKQALWCFFSPDRTRGLQEISQGRSTTAHSYCRAGMQIFVWFCRMYALGTCDPIWRKWVTQFDFGGCYSYPVRKRVEKKKKNKTQEEKNPRKETEGGRRQMSRQWMECPWPGILTHSVLCWHSAEKIVIPVRMRVMEHQIPEYIF